MGDKSLEEFTNAFAIAAGENRHYEDEEGESMYNYSIGEVRRFLRLEFYNTIYATQTKRPNDFREQLKIFVRNLNSGELD